MYARIREYIEKRIRWILSILTGAVIVLWILSKFIHPLSTWLSNEGFLEVIILALLAETVTLLIEFKRHAISGDLHIIPDQYTASKELIQLVNQHRPKKAKLIQISSATTDTLLTTLRKEDCHIRLLIQNPNSAICDFQKNRITQSINVLENLTLNGYEQCEVRLYSVPCSIRGISIDEKLIYVGWYTYSNDNVGLHGHDNPLITAQGDTPDSKYLHKMFQQAFDCLWEHPDTITLANFIKQTPALQQKNSPKDNA